MDPRELTTEASTAVRALTFGHSADRAQLLAALAEHKTRPVLRQHLDYVRGSGLRRWNWYVEDETSGEILAGGWTFTARAAGRRKHRAYNRLLNAKPGLTR
jgi:hypothetical protein